MMYRFDRAQLDELRLLRDEAARLNTDFETFAANYFSMRLDQFRIWLSTGLKPDDGVA